MTRDLHRDIAIAFLKETGYQVKPIPTAQTHGVKRADILAESATDTLIVEVKSRLDEDGFADRVKRTSSGQHVDFQNKIRRNETLSSAIEDASRQIESTKCIYPNAFGIVWLRPQQKFGLFDTLEIALATLLGVKYAHVIDPDGTMNLRKCYYCDFSDFYRYRNIAAVIFNKAIDGLLIPNKWCPEAGPFRRTLLFQDYEKAEAIFDPHSEVDSGEALVLDGEADLKDEDSIVRALQAQYPGLRVIFTDKWEVGGVIPLG
jgi:hypothetical protein